MGTMENLAARIEETLQGFRGARVLLSAIELDLFTAVGMGATADAVARDRSLDPRATAIVLNALVGLGFLEKRGDEFVNSAEGIATLCAGGERDARAALTHSVHMWDRWSRLTEITRSGKGESAEQRAKRPAGSTEVFIAAMHRHSTSRAASLVSALDLRGVRTVLDVGGGSGGFAIALAAANPGVTVTVLDLPDVTRLTRQYIERAGMSERVVTRDGDILKDESFGVGYDVVLISSVLHIFSPERCREILRKASRALAPGGRVAIWEFLLDESRVSPLPAALFAVNMLTATEGGNSYTVGDYSSWLRESGLGSIESRRVEGPFGLVVGRS